MEKTMNRIFFSLNNLAKYSGAGFHSDHKSPEKNLQGLILSVFDRFPVLFSQRYHVITPTETKVSCHIKSTET